ncbi:MAG: hypothetical protein P4L83_06265 [Nevskia sp.]|nr:hypothetical protein [Nevskia sp.]
MLTRRVLAVLALAAGMGSVVAPVSAADIEPPPGQWRAGDIPATGGAPGGFDYIGIKGVTGQHGLTREYKVHIPKSYQRGVPTPLVFCLPGFLENTSMFCVRGTNTSPYSGNGTSGGLVDQSERNGFILVMAQGYQDSWNGGVCCGSASSLELNLDDVALIRAILAEVKQHLDVDASRVYAVGFSNGAFMADRLACEASDMIAAIVEGSGGIRTLPMSDCKPKHHVPVLGTHGQGGRDYFVRYSTDQASMAQFASAQGCAATTVPAVSPASVGDGTHSGDVTCVTYASCPSDTEVTFCSVQDGGHCWYGSPSCGTGFGTFAADISLGTGVNTQNLVNSDIVWPFLSKYSR